LGKRQNAVYGIDIAWIKDGAHFSFPVVPDKLKERGKLT
jgi:hypothetical protein